VPNTLRFMANGTTMAFDEMGQQNAEIQKYPWLAIALARLESLGYDPKAFEILMPSRLKVRPEKVDGRWTWSFE